MYEWMVKKFSDKKNNVRASLPALVLPLFLVVISLVFLAGLVRVCSQCRRSSVHWRHCAGMGPGVADDITSLAGRTCKVRAGVWLRPLLDTVVYCSCEFWGVAGWRVTNGSWRSPAGAGQKKQQWQ